MEKSVVKGKKKIRLQLIDSIQQAVQGLGLKKSKNKIEKVISKAAKRIADLVADQLKKDVKTPKKVKEKKVKVDKTKKAEKVKKVKSTEQEAS